MTFEVGDLVYFPKQDAHSQTIYKIIRLIPNAWGDASWSYRLQSIHKGSTSPPTAMPACVLKPVPPLVQLALSYEI